MAGRFDTWSKTAADNGTVDASINFAEGQLPSTVNNSNRAEMAALASFRDDINGSLTAGGSSNAYTLTTNVAFAALATGLMVAFKANHTNTGAATLNANAIGAKALRTQADQGLLAGQIVNNGQYVAKYDAAANSAAGAWLIQNATSVEPVLATNYGITGDVSQDATDLLNAMFSDHAGKTILLPPGKITISDTVIIPDGTVVMGTGAPDPRYPGTQGTTFYVEHTSGEALRVGRAVGLRNFAMYWPDQTTGSSPTVYDWAIKFQAAGVGDLANGFACDFDGLTIHNAYKGIDFGGDASDGSPTTGQHVLRSLRMFALHTGVHLGHTLVSVYFNNVDMSPVYWVQSVSQAIREWVFANGNACVHIEGRQGVQINLSTFFGHRRGVLFSNPTGDLASNAVAFFSASNTIFDGLETGIEVADKAGINGAAISGCTFLANTTFGTATNTSKCIHFNSSENANVLELSGNLFLGTAGDHIVGRFASSGYLRLNSSGNLFYNANRLNEAVNHYNLDIDGSSGSTSAGWVNLNGDAFYNPTGPTTVTCIKVNGVGQYIDSGIIHKDTASVLRNISSINTPPVFGPAATAQTASTSTYPTTGRTIASAQTITLSDQSDTAIIISGTTTIETITASWIGRRVTLRFSSAACRVTNGSNLVLIDNFISTGTGSTLTLVMGSGGNWYELARANARNQILSQVSGVPAVAPQSGNNALFSDSDGRLWLQLPSGRLIPHGTPSVYLVAINNSTTVQALGSATSAEDGTATAVATATTNFYTRQARLTSVSAAAGASNCGRRVTASSYRSEAGRVRIRFGIEAFQTGMAMFAGLRGSAVHGDADPSSFTNIIGVGIDAGQTTFRLLTNDNSGSATATDLGANFPANTSATDWYELTLWWSASGSINYQFLRMNTGDMAQGTVSSDLPQTTQLMGMQVVGNTRAGTSAITLAFQQMMADVSY